MQSGKNRLFYRRNALRETLFQLLQKSMVKVITSCINATIQRRYFFLFYNFSFSISFVRGVKNRQLLFWFLPQHFVLFQKSFFLGIQHFHQTASSIVDSWGRYLGHNLSINQCKLCCKYLQHVVLYLLINALMHLERRSK